MQNAMWLATIFGPFLALIGLWMLLYADNVSKVATAIKNSPSAFFFSAAVNLLIGLAILSQYDMWSSDAYVLVTLLGWFMVLRGVVALFLPQLFVQIFLTGTGWSKGMGIIPLVWGLILCWLAFFM